MNQLVESIASIEIFQLGCVIFSLVGIILSLELSLDGLAASINNDSWTAILWAISMIASAGFLAIVILLL